MKTSTIISIVISTSVVVVSAVVTGGGGSLDTRIVPHIEQTYDVSPTSTIVSGALMNRSDVSAYKIVVSETFAGANDMTGADYPTWLVRSFALSLGVLAVGLISVFYVVLAGVSSTALAGTYLIPIGLAAIYYLLGIAEKQINVH